MEQPDPNPAPSKDRPEQDQRSALQAKLHPMFAGTGGIDDWIGPGTDEGIVRRLSAIGDDPLSRAQLNQLLVLGHETGVPAGFFSYYWLETPDHPYDVASLGGFDSAWLAAGGPHIVSLDHLRWGLYRLYVDCLLFFGNIRSGYRFLRALERNELAEFFRQRRVDTIGMQDRGAPLPLSPIPQDDRHLIAEVACKSLEDPEDLRERLLRAYQLNLAQGRSRMEVKQLFDRAAEEPEPDIRQDEFMFAVDDILEQQVASEDELELAIGRLVKRYRQAREAALTNTRMYLSMAGDLDVYVATSMRRGPTSEKWRPSVIVFLATRRYSDCIHVTSTPL